MFHSPPDFSHFLRYTESNWAPLVLIPEWVGLCTLWTTVGPSNDLSCEAESFSCCCLNPQRFEALFPCTGALGCAVSFAPSLFIQVYVCENVGPWGLLPTTVPALFSTTLSPALLVYLCVNVGPWGLLAVGLPAPFVPHSSSLWVLPWQGKSSPPWLPISAPPTDLDECFFFISLVVGLPCRSIFCQFGCARRRSVSTYTSILVPTVVCYISK